MNKRQTLPTLVVGACGFIGTCLCNRLLNNGKTVVAIDNLSRPGSELNAVELARRGLQIHRIDITDLPAIDDFYATHGPFYAVYHLAAQVAVTTSYENRRHDFQVNAAGSFNIIETTKRRSPDAYCLYASTNKVYGNILTSTPVGLQHALNPYTPYGVSKAAGELYFSEYGRKELGMTTCSLRQSCIYGHHQFGVEDQGWLAWFTIANLTGKNIKIYGNGNQVRDLLFVDDLIDLYLVCTEKRITGTYPAGGGTENQTSLNEALKLIEKTTGIPFSSVTHADPRPGDQPYFVADMAWAKAANLSWHPTTGVEQGLQAMLAWARSHEHEIRDILNGAA